MEAGKSHKVSSGQKADAEFGRLGCRQVQFSTTPTPPRAQTPEASRPLGSLGAVLCVSKTHGNTAQEPLWKKINLGTPGIYKMKIILQKLS